MMFASLRNRLWLTYVLLSAGILCIVCLGLALYILRNSPSIVRTYQNIQNIATFIEKRPALLKNLQRTDKIVDVRVAVMDPNGSITFDSLADAEPPIPPLSFPYPQKGKPPANLRFTDSQGKVWFYTARLLNNGDILIVAMPRPPAPLQQILRENIYLFLTGIAALILALLLASWMSRWITDPLRRAMKSTHALASGKHEPIPLEGPSEVQDLARTFNEMSQRIQASQQSQRDFVANVSHDLKTPLTSIQGFAQAILDGTANAPEQLQQAAGVIYSESGRMHRMVLDLLDLARMDAGIAEFKRAPIDLVNLLRGVAEKFTPQARQMQINLQSEITPLTDIVGDEDRLVQVFTNLVDNALKYTPSGGQVAIQARQVGSQVEVSVSDNGPGIPPEELPRIFERFYQTDKARRGGSGRGIGLGLAITREIVLAHNGNITATSLPGQGSTFVVTLPVIRPEDSTIAKRKK